MPVIVATGSATMLGTATPWSVGTVNPTFPFNGSGTGTGALVIPLGALGNIITLTYTSGLASFGGAEPLTDAAGRINGVGAYPGPSGVPVALYCPPNVKPNTRAAIACWTDATGKLVGNPFGMFTSSLTWTSGISPVGVTQLQVGMADDIGWGNNLGSWNFDYTVYSAISGGTVVNISNC